MSAPDAWAARVMEALLRIDHPETLSPMARVQGILLKLCADDWDPNVTRIHDICFARIKGSASSRCLICGHRIEATVSLELVSKYHRDLHQTQVEFVLQLEDQEPSWRHVDGST